MLTKTSKKVMELFDFADLIDGHIEFSGSFGKENRYVNAVIHKGYKEGRLEHGHLCCFGRSENADLDEALEDLADGLSGKKIWFDCDYYQVPRLKHTKGYRG